MTRYEFDTPVWFLHPDKGDGDSPGASLPGSTQLHVLGGGDGKGRVLMPSHGWLGFEAGEDERTEYIVIARRQGEILVPLSAGRLDLEFGLVLTDGRVLGADPETGAPAISRNTPGEPLDRWRRVCGRPRPGQRQIPLGEAGLRAHPIRATYEPALGRFDRAQIIQIVSSFLSAHGTRRGDVRTTPPPQAPEKACGSCRPLASQTGLRGWVDRPIEFEAGGGLYAGAELAWAQHCFESWSQILSARRGRGRPEIFRWARRDGGVIHSDAAHAGDGRSGIAFRGPKTRYPRCSDEHASNGCAYVWVDRESARVVEVDILIATTRSRNHDFAATLTHELGHALTLGHECGFISVTRAPGRAHPKVLSKPSSYLSDTVRAGDFHCLRSLLREFNVRAGGRPWHAAGFADLATVAAVHPAPGHPCALVSADCSAREPDGAVAQVRGGQKLLITNVHIENRGTRPACQATLTFVLHEIGGEGSSRVIGRYHFLQPIRTWLTADYEVRMPRPWSAKNKHYISWHVTHAGRDRTPRNDWTTLRHGVGGNPVEVEFLD